VRFAEWVRAFRRLFRRWLGDGFAGAGCASLLARMVTIWAKGMKKADGVAGRTRNLSAMRLAASSLSIQMPAGSTPTRVTVSSLA
jgi:hypothetical protein